MSRHVEHCLSKVEGPSPPPSPPLLPLTLAAHCLQIYGLLGSLCGLSSFLLSVLCSLPLLSLSHSSPGAPVENYWGKAQVFDL